MFRKLLKEAQVRGVNFLDFCTVIDLLTIEKENQKQIVGLLVLHKSELAVVRSNYVIYGTGGPGALYWDSVYPRSQLGSLGIALRAGAKAQNLSESQFGIASTVIQGSYQHSPGRDRNNIVPATMERPDGNIFEVADIIGD